MMKVWDAKILREYPLNATFVSEYRYGQTGPRMFRYRLSRDQMIDLPASAFCDDGDTEGFEPTSQMWLQILVPRKYER